MPHTDLFAPSFTPSMMPSYPFADHVKYEYAPLPPKTTSTTMIPNSPSRTPPRSPSESGSESAPEEVRSAFVPIRLNTLPRVPSSTPSSSSPERTLPRKPEGTRNELKAPTVLISQRTNKRSPSPTKISSPQATKPVWRPY